MKARVGFALVVLVFLASCGGSGGSSNISRGSDGGGSAGGGAGTGGSGGTGSTSTACSAMATGQGASLNGFRPFPAGDAWNTDISSAPTDPNSTAIINDIGTTLPLHPDFGSGEYDGQNIGIPYVVVDGTQALVAVNFTAYGDESDPGPMPVPSNAPIEGDPAPGNGDRHVLVLDKGNCFLYEMYSSYPGANGSWMAQSAAVWDLTASEQRPYTWTSADAAGLPIFPGLARYDEVAAGAIQHALRFTLPYSRAAFVAPASHLAGNTNDPFAAPMGMRLRLKASFDISGYSAANQIILKALKQYGMIMADNGGGAMYLDGAPDSRWDNDDLHQLTNLNAADFEVVRMANIYTAGNVPTGTAPVISSFGSSAMTTTSTGAVTLSWTATGASYYVISPQAGAVRGNSITVTPGQTTSYTLSATNQYGRSTASVNVVVQ